MTQEDKQLLLKDLCARLPYGVMCKIQTCFVFEDGTHHSQIKECAFIDNDPVDEKGKIVVELDYRGARLCPMIEHYNEIIFDKKFLSAVKKIGKY